MGFEHWDQREMEKRGERAATVLKWRSAETTGSGYAHLARELGWKFFLIWAPSQQALLSGKLDLQPCPAAECSLQGHLLRKPDQRARQPRPHVIREPEQWPWAVSERSLWQ